jgi:hypothetical protein
MLAAAAIGVLQLGVTLSLAALIFSGPLALGGGRAAAGFVLGTAIVSLIVGATSKLGVVTAGAQDTAAVLVAAVASAIVAAPELTAEEMLPTVVVMIAIAGVPRIPNMLVSVAILGAAFLFHVISRSGSSLQELEAAGWFIGPDLIAYVPRAVAAGVLAGLGVSMLVSWLRHPLPRMNRGDQMISTFILLVIAGFGVLTGVGAGLVAAVAVFIVKYSRTNPVRHVIDAAGRSRIDRHIEDQAILEATPESIIAFELLGYLFFGSITSVRRQIDKHLDHAIAWSEDLIVASANVDGPCRGHDPGPFSAEIMDVLDLPVIKLPAGSTLIAIDDTDHDMYFVESGTLTAWLHLGDGQPVRIRQVLPGAALGEIAFVSGTPRTATVTADTDVVVRVLRREHFEAIAQSRPEIAIAVQEELLRRIATRLAGASAMVRDLLE